MSDQGMTLEQVAALTFPVTLTVVTKVLDGGWATYSLNNGERDLSVFGTRNPDALSFDSIVQNLCDLAEIRHDDSFCGVNMWNIVPAE